MRILECNYHQSKKDRFQMEIIDEDDENYIVKYLPEWKNKMADGDKITKLRKCLIPDLYIIKDYEPKQIISATQTLDFNYVVIKYNDLSEEKITSAEYFERYGVEQKEFTKDTLFGEQLTLF